MLSDKSKIRSSRYILKYTGSFLLILGLSVWFGSLVFFGAGVAPVHFTLASEWNLTGTNPAMPQQSVHPQTVGGALTAASIRRLNLLEFVSALLMLLGVATLWRTDENRSRWLVAETVTLGVNLLLLTIYAFFIGERLFEIQQTIPLDFSNSGITQQSTIHKEFENLHQWYSALAKINLALLFLHFVFLTSHFVSGQPGSSGKRSNNG